MRRACFALATGLLLAATALPGVLLASSAPAGASPMRAGQAGQRSQPSAAPVSVAITSMNPTIAAPGHVITVSGTVKNASKQAISIEQVQLAFSGTPISDIATLQTDLQSNQAGQLASTAVGGRVQLSASELQPGQTTGWHITFHVNALGLSSFGVYPLTVQVSTSLAPAFANTFLPYLPPTRKHHRSTTPGPQQIAWVWPLIDQPLTGLPGQAQCLSLQARVLEASMGPGGRLDGLLSAGASATKQDQLTWAIDPALLWDARQLSRCATTPAGKPGAAGSWLAQVRTATARQPLFVTPFANVNLALLRQGEQQGVTQAFQLGWQEAGAILKRNVTPPSASASPGAQPSAASIAWPTDGLATSSTASYLAGTIKIQTMLLSSTLTSGTGSVFQVFNGAAGYDRVLLYSGALNQLLGKGGASAAAQFTIAQGFLAETAVLAAQYPGQPIVVAPPEAWRAPAALAQTLLAETAHTPWLKPATLTSVAAGARKQLPLPPTGGPPGLRHRVLTELSKVGYAIEALSLIQKNPNPVLSLVLAAEESSAWPNRSERQQLARLGRLARYVNQQRHGVSIGVDSKGVTLGGLKGSVPVVIENQLSYPVVVKVRGHPIAQPVGGGFTWHQSPPGLVVVHANSEQPIKLRVQFTQVGSVSMELQLLNKNNTPLLSAPVTVTVHATQFGNLALIILAAALGIFVLASATRAIRKRADPDNSSDAGHSDSDGPQQNQEDSEPDTVVRERNGLEAAGTPGTVTKERD